MNTNYKEEIEKILETLDAKGIKRGKIEKDLGYSENYIDQVLSKGGNRKILKKLKTYLDEKQYAMPKDGLAEDRAVIKTLIYEVAKLKSKIYGIKFEDAVEELRQNSKTSLLP
jgi:uncharacterized protein with von Willebrand factor type A (vWA) domain